jgi:hypothetical protein
MSTNPIQACDSKESQELALHYMKTLVEVARESFLILDSNLRVVCANPTFYENFRVSPEQTENVFLYELGNGQWDIPILKSLLEEILPQKKVVKEIADDPYSEYLVKSNWPINDLVQKVKDTVQ